MISAPPEKIQDRAGRWSEQIGGRVIPGNSTIGGGSLPGETLPTFLLAWEPSSPNRALDALRESDPPIIARIQDNCVLLDPRTVLPEQDGALMKGLGNVFHHLEERI
jgi:L-seryl-tRNA(Ser) seleniumtransferase